MVSETRVNERHDHRNLLRIVVSALSIETDEGAPSADCKVFRAVGKAHVATNLRIFTHTGIPATIGTEDAAQHFGFLGFFVGADCPTSSALTQERLAWRPTMQPGLIAELDHASAFEASISRSV
jgi:hypothetical protein